MRKFRLILAITTLLAVAPLRAEAPAPPPPPPASQTDPAALGWMRGSPPPADRQVRFADFSFYAFPQIRWSFAHFRELVPTARVSRGSGPVSPLPLALRPDIGRVTFSPAPGAAPVNWVKAFDDIYGDAVVVLHRGRIVFEKYNGVMNKDRPHINFSVTKSYFGTLTEMLIAEGQIDENKRIDHYIPELAGSGFADATVREVLDMTTGLDYNEHYGDPQSHITRFAQAGGLFPTPADYTGPRNSYDYLKTVKKVGQHGVRFDYQSVDTQVLGWLVAKVTGQTAQDLLADRIWSRIGAEHDGDMLVDSAGMAIAAGGLNTTTRDMARFGEMMRLNGRINGRQVVPAAVVARIRAGADKTKFAAAGYDTMKGWSYKSQWWISHNPNGAFMAIGIHGQNIYIDPRAEMVIAAYKSNPVASSTGYWAMTVPAYDAIAAHLIRTTARR